MYSQKHRSDNLLIKTIFSNNFTDIQPQKRKKNHDNSNQNNLENIKFQNPYFSFFLHLVAINLKNIFLIFKHFLSHIFVFYNFLQYNVRGLKNQKYSYNQSKNIGKKEIACIQQKRNSHKIEKYKCIFESLHFEIDSKILQNIQKSLSQSGFFSEVILSRKGKNSQIFNKKTQQNQHNSKNQNNQKSLYVNIIQSLQSS